MIRNFGYPSNNGKRNWVSALLSSEMHYLCIGQVLTLARVGLITQKHVCPVFSFVTKNDAW